MKVVGPTESTEIKKDCNSAPLMITHTDLDNLDETHKSLETKSTKTKSQRNRKAEETHNS